MRNMLLIAKREYFEQIRARAFLMTTIGLPALFVVILGIGYAANLGLGGKKHLVITADNPALANEIREQLTNDNDGKLSVDVLPSSDSSMNSTLMSELQNKSINGILSIKAQSGELPVASYTSLASGDFMTGARLRRALNNGLVGEQLKSAGVTAAEADSLLKGISIQTFQLKKDGSIVRTSAEASLWKGYVMALLLSMTTMIYGLNVARSVIQEKTSRIFEVMLATVKPTDMLAGKLIGLGAVGLTQILIWLIAAVALVVTPFAAAMLTGEYSLHFSWFEGVLFPLYFLLGYLLYSSLFAGLASTCETEQELQMYMPLAAAPTWLSFAMIVLIMNDSNSPWAVAASLFPPTAPIVMFLRMASETPPAWQFVVSIGLLVASIIATLWFSSRLYRVGILMYGKRASLPELLRWLRYS
ncbi:MAG TPA: ABC transporter permease [Terracidiphilus sp.]|jgi:ABC-2 type transport system permease protein|nr:ABC transporter permease [Terracidiphilus sp.]